MRSFLHIIVRFFLPLSHTIFLINLCQMCFSYCLHSVAISWYDGSSLLCLEFPYFYFLSFFDTHRCFVGSFCIYYLSPSFYYVNHWALHSWHPIIVQHFGYKLFCFHRSHSYNWIFRQIIGVEHLVDLSNIISIP